MQMTGAEIVVNTLIDLGVKHIFGYPGGAVLHIYDALYDYQDKLQHILTAHEQGAAHAADGYARSTGKTGVVLATSGPGATNLVTGIATAYMDSVPMVCITGNVGSKLIGKDSFQEIYITGITLPITKHNFVVRNVNEISSIIKKAFEIANRGRKGPVLIDIPKDVTAQLAEYIFDKTEENKIYQNAKPTNIDKIKEVAELINASKKPVIYAGGGIISGEASKKLRALMNKANIPSCNTIMGLGILGEKDRLNLGMVGMHGEISTNFAIENSDLLLALGVRFSDRVALNTQHFAPNAKIIHIDIDASEIGKNVIPYCGVVGDIGQILDELLPLVNENKRETWLADIDVWRSTDYKPEDSNEKIKPHQVISYVADCIGDEGIFVTDVGQHQMWAAQYSKRTIPRTFVTSGGLGTMGFGYGAAIGAKFANPNKSVVHITGDGSFHMNMNECSTAVDYEVNIITIVMNNNSLGMPRQWQHHLHNERYASSGYYRKTDYVKLAQAFGGVGYHCESIGDFKKAFDEAINVKNKPVIIECVIDKDEEVLPMIPAGGTVKDIIK